jgi:hypothetical protein
MGSIDTDYRCRALYGRELGALVLSAITGAVAAGFAAFVVSGSGLSIEDALAGGMVLFLALLPVLVTLVPGTLLQVAAAPTHGFRFHVATAFAAGALYFAGFVALVGTAGGTETQAPIYGAAPVAAWIYWLIGPLLVPPVVADLAGRFWVPRT